jgi:hypothetical protein
VNPRPGQRSEDAEIDGELGASLHARAPWFTAGIKAIMEPGELERMAARAFGQGRCWLVGTRAQTSPWECKA